MPGKRVQFDEETWNVLDGAACEISRSLPTKHSPIFCASTVHRFAPDSRLPPLRRGPLVTTACAVSCRSTARTSRRCRRWPRY
jgi:hypothetical protein